MMGLQAGTSIQDNGLMAGFAKTADLFDGDCSALKSHYGLSYSFGTGCRGQKDGVTYQMWYSPGSNNTDKAYVRATYNYYYVSNNVIYQGTKVHNSGWQEGDCSIQ